MRATNLRPILAGMPDQHITRKTPSARQPNAKTCAAEEAVQEVERAAHMATQSEDQSQGQVRGRPMTCRLSTNLRSQSELANRAVQLRRYCAKFAASESQNYNQKPAVKRLCIVFSVCLRVFAVLPAS